MLKGHPIGKGGKPGSRGYSEHPQCERVFPGTMPVGRMALDLTSTALSPGPWALGPGRGVTAGLLTGVSVSFSEQHSRAIPSVLPPAGPCQLPGEWLPTASKRSVHHKPSSQGCAGPQGPRQRLAQATPSCGLSESKSPVSLVSQMCQLLAQAVEKQPVFSVPCMAGTFQFLRTPLCPGSPAFGCGYWS